MIGPDQDINEFPRWMWPYINIAKIAEITHKQPMDHIDARVPAVAIHAHMMAIMSAVTLRKVAAGLGGEMSKQFSVAANRALKVAIDDCGSTGNKPWPMPPRGAFLCEMAGHLAMAAAELEGDEIMHHGLKEAMTELLAMAQKR